MIREIGAFAAKQFASSIFALAIFVGLVIAPVVPVPRYDFMLALCLAIQVWMVRSRLESFAELRLVCLFHGLGLGLELYKVNTGSWSYPEFSYTKFWGVPLYSGFMYASVASYILQASRNFDLQYRGMPSGPAAWLMLGLIYANFFFSRVWGDWRLPVLAVLAVGFWKARVDFTCARGRFTMPMLVAFPLIGFFVWVAENMCTYLNAWVYPHQELGWSLVHPAKITSWSMMVIVAFVCVWRWQERRAAANLKPQAV